MKKLKPHELLAAHGYNGHTAVNFPEIAKFTAKKIKAGETAESVILAVKNRWPILPKAGLLEQANPFTIFGTTGTDEMVKDGLADFDYATVDQLRQFLRIPVAFGGALMPDGHVGYGLPIGGVAALVNAVTPFGVGYDIGCRLRLSVLPLTWQDVDKNKLWFLEKMKASTHFGSDNPPFHRDHEVMEDDRWNQLDILKQLKSKAAIQLGTQGAGNHFLDLVKIEVTREVPWLGLPVGTKVVGLMSHSGSRGTGHKFATRYVEIAEQYTNSIARGIPKQNAWLGMDTQAGQDYFIGMNLLGDYAAANHWLVHQTFMQSTGIWAIKSFENHHNFSWIEEHFGETLYVHRKGATPTDGPGIIPGSCAGRAVLVEGLAEESSFHSASHGAGRVESRTNAKKNYDAEKVKALFEEVDVLVDGVDLDENPFAYKDPEHVIELQEGVLFNTVANMYPTIVHMGGNKKSDDGD